MNKKTAFSALRRIRREIKRFDLDLSGYGVIDDEKIVYLYVDKYQLMFFVIAHEGVKPTRIC